jgi:VWFA-related protein
METRAFSTIMLCLGLWLAAPLAAQDDPSLFLDTVDVYVVNVEVIVTDKDGNPVNGLGREDFEVYEDGKKVDVSNFFAVEGRQAVIDADAGQSVETAPTPETRRLNLVVFIDNLNMNPRNRNQIFDNLRAYLRENLDSRDRVMLVSMSDRVEVAQNFTNDVDLLLSTIDRLEKVQGAGIQLDTRHRMLLRRMQRATLPPATGSSALDVGSVRTFEAAQDDASNIARDVTNLAESRVQQVAATVQALEEFTNSLAGMRGRKAVLYVSDGIPQRPADSLAQAWLNKFSDWIIVQGASRAEDDLRDMTVLMGSSRYDTSSRFDELIATASANRVAFYPLSNGGRQASSGISAEFGGAGTATGSSPLGPDVVALENQSLEGSLLQLAEGTGGLAFTRTANIGGLLEHMVHDFDSFYSLGYSPPHPVDDEFHEVQVKVKRKDLEVRHLEGYREKDPLTNLQDLTLSALHYGLEDNPLGVRIVPTEQTHLKGDHYNVTLMVQIPFKNLLLLPQEEFHTSQLSLFVIVGDDKGGVSPFRRIDLPVQIPNGKILEALTQAAAYPLRLEMEKGPKRISVGVRDHLSDVDATINLELDIGADTVATGPSGR